MNILLFTSYPDSWPYVPELTDNLRSRGCSVDIFDTSTLSLITLNSNILLVPKIWKSIIKSSSAVARLFRNYMLLPTAWYSLPNRYDVVNMHPFASFYCTVIPVIKTKCQKFIITVWGSDFLRSSHMKQFLQSLMVSYADVVSFNNPVVERKFIGRFQNKVNRTMILRFGFKSLEIIDNIIQSEGIDESKTRLGIKTDRIIVALGYNAMPEQQHLEMINAVRNLTEKAKKRYYFIIPATYPKNNDYFNKIKMMFSSAGIIGKILDDFLSMEDICRLRRICHIAVNVQSTDSFSASVQEHIYCGAMMIVGRWLPYDVLEARGIKFIRISDCKYITNVLEHLAGGEIATFIKNTSSRKIIYELSSWEININKWIQAYSS